MRKILQIFLVGLMLLSLSGLVAAEEWKTIQLIDEVSLSTKMPNNTKRIEKKQSQDNVVEYLYKNDPLSAGVKVSVVTLGKSEYSGYLMDRVSGEGEEQLLALIVKQSPQAENMKFVTLPNGHRAIMGRLKEAMGFEMVVIIEGYLIKVRALTVGADSETNYKDLTKILANFKF